MQRLRIVFFSALAFFILVLFIVWLNKGGLEKELVPLSEEVQPQWKDCSGPFISTRWKQDEGFSRFVPDSGLLGCWSVAFAQVLAYYHKEPTGTVNYRTSNGIVLNETFGDPVKWERIVPELDSLTPPENLLETSKYCYMASVVLQKDFGTGEYMDINIVPAEISDHYVCQVEKIENDVPEKIISELNSGRPVVAYFNDILGIRIVKNGHAVVMDGIAKENEDTFVHVNFGWGGRSDGWYSLKDLASERKLLYIFIISH